MRYTRDEVISYIEEEDVKFIRLAFCDAYGVQKNMSILAGEINKTFEDGIPINPREIAGFRDCPFSTLYLKPDLDTVAILPWRPDSGKVLRMFCDLYTPEGEVYRSDTRVILQDAVAEAERQGIEFKFGNETEFYLFLKDEYGNPTLTPYDNAGYMDIAPLDKCENVRREICLTIERMGLTPEKSHHERGPGQNEIDFHYGKPLKAADQMTTFKMVVNTLADLYGLHADFSPMPLVDKPGNGYHINTYAVDKDGNDMSRFVAAGIMDKIREITIFLNHCEDSYSRFGTNTAPDKVNWSSESDMGLLYIEKHGKRTGVELRSPDALCNPYLAYALLIRAGLYGINNKLILPDEMAESVDLLPNSMEEASKLALYSDFVAANVPRGIVEEYTRTN